MRRMNIATYVWLPHNSASRFRSVRLIRNPTLLLTWPNARVSQCGRVAWSQMRVAASGSEGQPEQTNGLRSAVEQQQSRPALRACETADNCVAATAAAATRSAAATAAAWHDSNTTLGITLLCTLSRQQMANGSSSRQIRKHVQSTVGAAQQP